MRHARRQLLMRQPCCSLTSWRLPYRAAARIWEGLPSPQRLHVVVSLQIARRHPALPAFPTKMWHIDLSSAQHARKLVQVGDSAHRAQSSAPVNSRIPKTNIKPANVKCKCHRRQPASARVESAAGTCCQEAWGGMGWARKGLSRLHCCR